ncbi:SusC/RagA family TonB-linked outer membrane protein [Arachidicoccus terrestris]|uniref:SusC/RagA family TonB-linked outer membrane protein n=1 Tax=Arachidicoccus terrestris TaxID=2875539 RepID=UPI001CC51241|nr:TonB-dependent receptor [Arachidicoccus terrestris]UAY55251.1 TonB-dependent receptor [Arachidicoccus terrestris]
MNFKKLLLAVTCFSTPSMYSAAISAPRLASTLQASQTALQQTVSGKVTDKNGRPLSGATVLEKGTTHAVTSSADGKFIIDVAPNAILQISFTGYETKEIPVNGQSKIAVQLTQVVSQMDDVVVVGYGTLKRSDVTGSIVSLKSESFNKGVVTNPVELLQGKMAGVNITSSSGEPGTSQNVIIRGIGSLRSGTQPLYVIDGFLIDNSSIGVASNPLNFLNPGDIASIDVLKDASATAVYGSRASNGVVVITTKKGKDGKTQINVGLSTAMSSMAGKIKVFDAAAFRKQVPASGGTLIDYGGNTNWQDELTQSGVSNNLIFSMSGATSQKFSYFASGGYQKQEGILKNSELERYSGKLNMTQKAWNGRINVDYNITASHIENLRPDINATISDMLGLNPTIPAYTNGIPTPLKTNELNPITRYNIYSDKALNNRFLATISPSIEIVKGLVYKLNFGIDYSSTNRDRQYKPYTSVVNESDVSNGDVVTDISTNSNQLTENTLTYSLSKPLYKLTAMVGHSYQKFTDNNRQFAYRGFADNNIEPIYQDQTSSDQYPTSVNSSAVKNELQSFFARINYSFDERFLVTATLRADGSSKFGDNRKYGYFPSFAFGWNIANEAFMKNSIFDNLKLRGGWGQTGNQEIPSKITQASYSETRLVSGSGSSDTYPINTNSNSIDGYPYGIVYTRLANPNLQWEVSTQFDFGFDFALLNNQLSGTVDYFNKKSSNILLEVVPTDPVEPTSTYWANIENMKIQNNGLELALNYNSDATRNFSYSLGGNITYIMNKVKNSPYSVLTTGSAQGAGQTGATINGYINNEPIGAFYLFRFDGIGADGLNKFWDANGDGTILDNDRRVLGSAIPDLIYGFNVNLKYKAFDFGMNFNGISGNKIYNHTKMSLFTKAQLSRSNNTTDFAVQFPSESIANSNTVSTRFLENGSFLRLNNATLSYKLDPGKIGLGRAFQDIRILLTGQNLFVITDYSGFDPELNTGIESGGIQTFGIDYYTYPKARTFMFGVNLTF